MVFVNLFLKGSGEKHSSNHGHAEVVRYIRDETSFDVGHLAQRIIEFRSLPMEVRGLRQLVKQLLRLFIKQNHFSRIHPVF